MAEKYEHDDGRQGPAPAWGISTIKTFSATKYRDRAALGDQVTEWLRENRRLQVVDHVVTQSSDQEYHCVTITLFCQERQG